jgi:hypothetical protein
MTTSSARTAGIAALALAGLADLATIILTYAVGSGSDDAPAPVMATVVVAGAVTVLGALLAARGSRGGLLAAYVARVVSAALGIPAYFLGAPWWVDVLVSVALILSVAGVWSTLPALRRPVAVRP